MNKLISVCPWISCALVGVLSVPAIAQGTIFKEVAKNDWAYRACDKLQRMQNIGGIPKGYFQGQRLLTRYEFAVAIKRVIAAYFPDVFSRAMVPTPTPDVHTLNRSYITINLVPSEEPQRTANQLFAVLPNFNQPFVTGQFSPVSTRASLSYIPALYLSPEGAGILSGLVKEFRDEITRMGQLKVEPTELARRLEALSRGRKLTKRRDISGWQELQIPQVQHSLRP